MGFEAFGYDIDPAAVALANANAKLAGVEKRCHFEVADVADFAAKQEAIVLTNPPYGERMSTIEGAAKAGPHPGPSDGGEPLRRCVCHHRRHGL